MLNRPNTTQQINTYIRSQQLLYRHLQLCQRIKKADHSRQEASAFRNQTINLNKVDYSNQSAQGANQYVTV